MPWILLLLISLFSTPSLAVAIPGVTTGATATQQNTPPPEPDAEQKKAAYGALADVLENDTSRQELIDQLRKVAATPPQDPVPTITPPQIEEEKTVLENVTDISRRYGKPCRRVLPSSIEILLAPRINLLIPTPSPQPPRSLRFWRVPYSFFTGCCACAPGRSTGRWATGDGKKISIKAAGCTSRP